jgi:hypothetical protein
MSLFRADRSRRGGEDPFLLWKVRLFVVGGGLGIAGMITEWSPLLWGGIAILAAGVGLRFGSREGRDTDAWDAGGDEWGAEAED